MSQWICAKRCAGATCPREVVPRKKREPFGSRIADNLPERGLAKALGDAEVDGGAAFRTVARRREAVEHVSAILAENVGFFGSVGGHVLVV
jgi:hypothetical protein